MKRAIATAIQARRVGPDLNRGGAAPLTMATCVFMLAW
jgi:hypothetical protein